MAMSNESISIELTWEDYEVAVENVLRAKGQGLDDLKVTRKETLQGSDGEFEMDVVARFTAFEGAQFTVLVECKHHKNSIKRELVQVLHSKLTSVGAHKAMMVTTAKYQRGAIEFADAHGISLIELKDSTLTYAVKAILVDAIEHTIDEDGNNSYEIICKGNALHPDISQDLLCIESQL